MILLSKNQRNNQLFSTKTGYYCDQANQCEERLSSQPPKQKRKRIQLGVFTKTKLYYGINYHYHLYYHYNQTLYKVQWKTIQCKEVYSWLLLVLMILYLKYFTSPVSDIYYLYYTTLLLYHITSAILSIGKNWPFLIIHNSSNKHL